MLRTHLLVILGGIMVVAILSSLTGHAAGLAPQLRRQARPTITSIPRATITSIPRPTLTPTVNLPIQKPPREPLVGHIILHLQPAASSVWSVVQWQDALGGWHDVEGWRGFVVNGRTEWWVEEKDFGSGPFRWVVSRRESEPFLATSEPFLLPTAANLSLTVALVVSNETG